VVNKINGFWIPACAGMTDFLRFLTFFNILLRGLTHIVVASSPPNQCINLNALNSVSMRLHTQFTLKTAVEEMKSGVKSGRLRVHR
jgi:hypothetical protein